MREANKASEKEQGTQNPTTKPGLEEDPTCSVTEDLFPRTDPSTLLRLVLLQGARICNSPGYGWG